MNPDLNISLSGITTAISRMFQRFGFIIIFLIVAAGIGASLFMLIGVIAKTDDPNGYVSDINQITFDKPTMDKLKSLSTEQAELDVSGRLLPF